MDAVSGSSLTSAVGKRGTANCSRPTTWICMVVNERWKMVSDWVERPQPSMRIHFPEVLVTRRLILLYLHYHQVNIQEGLGRLYTL